MAYYDITSDNFVKLSTASSSSWTAFSFVCLFSFVINPGPATDLYKFNSATFNVGWRYLDLVNSAVNHNQLIVLNWQSCIKSVSSNLLPQLVLNVSLYTF